MYPCKECLLVASCSSDCDKAQIKKKIKFESFENCLFCGEKHFYVNMTIVTRAVILCHGCGETIMNEKDHLECYKGKTHALINGNMAMFQCYLCSHEFQATADRMKKGEILYECEINKSDSNFKSSCKSSPLALIGEIKIRLDMHLNTER